MITASFSRGSASPAWTSANTASMLRILRRVAEAIGEVVGEACAHHRYPRPALTLSPSRAALLPA